VNVSFFKTSGTVSNQNPFAKDFGGLFPTLSDDKHSLHTVGKKTVRMFVNIQRLLNKSRTIEVTDLKFSGYTVLYVVY